jgi:mRNA interferase MazF
VKRGDLVLIALSGDYGKPRPALVIQSSLFSDHPSVTICLLTSYLNETPLFRFQVDPGAENGLAVPSQVQIDKLMTVPRGKIGQVIGRLTRKQMYEVAKLLALWIGIAED